MKGGVTSKAQVVKIGSPSTYHIAGRIFDGAEPLPNATITAGARTAVSDSDGRYFITGLPAGSYTLKAVLEGYIFSRSGFSNPLSVSPSRDGADFYALRATSQNTIPLVAGGSTWKFWDKGGSLPISWRTVSYSDAAWGSGAGPLGYGGDNEKTVIKYGPDSNNKFITSYFRKTFTLANKQSIAGLTMSLRRDDGAVVYLNNREVYRSNLPAGTISSTTLATSAVGGGDETTYFDAEIDPSILVNGSNILAVEIHQSSGNSSDAGFDLKLVGVNVDAVLPAPSLNWQIIGSSIKLSWPDTPVIWSLGVSSDVGAAGLGENWSILQAPISLLNGRRSATIPVGEGQQFFRLQR
jgi:hypothetical protein